MKRERLGLLLIGASLVVILLVTGLVAKFHRDGRRDQTRAQGASLSRLLSRLPYERLAQESGQHGPLQVVRSSLAHLRNPEFAYGVIVGLDGSVRVDVSAPGIVLPEASLPNDPASWLGERVLASPGGGREIREFLAPVFSGGERVAHLRLGFLEPDYAGAFEEAPLFGVVALLVFALTPFAYFLVRREFEPLSRLNERLGTVAARHHFQTQVDGSGSDARSLVGTFNHFVEMFDGRVKELESRQTGVLASSKILAYKKSRMEMVLEAFPEATVVLDEKGHLTFANAKFEGLLGISPQDAADKPPAVWCPYAQVVDFLLPYAGTAGGRPRSETLEFSPAGTEKRFAVSAHPLAVNRASHENQGTLVLFRDVTAESLATQAQGEFVSHVAHELKTPLNGLAMYSEMLMGKDGESEDFRIETANVFRDEIERLSTLINTLLSIARIETGNVILERQRLRLGDFLNDCIEAVLRSARTSGVSLQLDLPSDPPVIYVDKDLIRVAVNNLLTNAVKYSVEGGEVEVSVEDSSDRLWIHVRDHGIGIAPEDQERVFEKFFRSESEAARARVGHGLGLTLARELVELHGGSIELESTLGEGSRFSISLRKTASLADEAKA